MSDRIADAMSRSLITAAPLTPLPEVMATFTERHIRHLPVVDDGSLVGLISKGDLLNRAVGPLSWLDPHESHAALAQMTAREVMTDELTTVSSDGLLVDAAKLLLESQFGCLPVVDDGRLVGILTEADFVRRCVEAG